MSEETTTTAPGTAVERHVDLDMPLAPALVNSRELKSLQAMANAYSKMPGLPKQYAGNPDAVMAGLLTAHSLDLPPNPVILSQFYDVQGRLYPSTQILIALAARQGLEVWFDPASDDTKATAYCRRAGQHRPPDAYTYTIEMAKKAGLTNKDVWKQHPEIMLRYRASSRLLRTVAADVVLGIPSAFIEGDKDVSEANFIQVPDDDEVVEGEIVDGGEVEQPPAPSSPSTNRSGSIPQPDRTACRVNGCDQRGKHTHDPFVRGEFDEDDPERPY